MPDETSRERWYREDATEATRAHELELAKIKSQSPWAETARVVLVWAIIAFVICFYVWASK